MFNKKILFASAALLTGLVQTPFAQGWNTFGLGGMERYVDFSATSTFSNHAKFGTWTKGTANPGTTKYFDMLVQGKSTGSCFIISTSGASASNTVTNIAAYGANNGLIDDNGPNGSVMPYFKIFTFHDTFFKLSAFDTNNNNRDFNVQITEFAASSATACKNLNNQPTIPLYDGQLDKVVVGPTTSN